MLRATLNEGPSSKLQWDRTILLHEGHKLDSHPLDENLRAKSGKLRLNLHGTILKGNSIDSDPKKKLYKGKLVI